MSVSLFRPKKVTGKQLVSHYFGFGNIKLDNLNSPKGKTTGMEGSGKFQQRLHLKQKQIEVSTKIDWNNFVTLHRLKCLRIAFVNFTMKSSAFRSRSRSRTNILSSPTKSSSAVIMMQPS